nr:hypothetical protein [Melissococcus plutonius]
MDNKISFPKNYERYIELGQAAMDAKNTEAALDYFLKAYAIHQDFSLNFLIVSMYLGSEQPKTALTIASELKKDYLSSVDSLEFYIQLLIQNHQFIEAHILINDQLLLKKTKNIKPFIALKKQVCQTELLYQQFETSKITELEQNLKILQTYSYFEQLTIIKQAVQLPKERFIKIGKEILLNSDVHYLVCSWLLNEFEKLNLTEKICFLWIDQKTYQVIPANIGDPMDSEICQRVLLYLEKELINDHPILLLELKEEIQLHFVLLYPLIDQIITDPKLWTISYISFYDHSLVNFDDNNQEDMSNIKRFQEIQNNIRFNLDAVQL